MKSPMRYVFAACVLAQVGFSDLAAAEPAPSTQLGEEISAGKSIFLRDRRTQVKGDESITAQKGPIEAQFVLRGVVFEGNTFWAYVEGSDPDATLRLKVGDPVAGGQVTEIEMDGIGYLKDGQNQSRRIGPGRNFAGALVNLRESRR